MTIRLAIVLMALAPAVVLAQEKPEQKKEPSAAEKAMQEMAWLVGKWTGKGEMNGQTFTDTTEYKWMFGKKFIRSKYVATMGGKVVWTDNTTIGYDRAKKRLAWFTFGMDGSIGGGHWSKSKKKNEWIVLGRIDSDNKDFKDSRSILRLIDKDTFSSEVQTRREGTEKWVTFMTTTRKRVKPKPKKGKQ